jgi:uncharacterized protein (DUF58 family)
MRQPELERPASIFPTLFVQAFMLLFLFLALIYNETELTLFTLLCLSMALGAFIWSRISLNHVTCAIKLDRFRLFPDEGLKTEIQVTNAKLLPIRFGVELNLSNVGKRSTTGHLISEETALFSYARRQLRDRIYLSKRGVYNLGPPKMRGSDICGFYGIQKSASTQLEIIVYPRIISIRPIAVPKRFFYGTPGAKGPIDDPVYIFGTRDYQPGRPSRSIHWKASARHHRLQEKLCEPAEQEKVLFILDADQFQNDPAKEDFEKSLEVIGSLALEMDQKRIAIGLVTNAHICGNKSPIIPISGSPGHIQKILETLARSSAVDRPVPVATLLSKAYRLPWGVSCLYFAHHFSEQVRIAGEFIGSRRTPMQLILARRLEAGNLRGDLKRDAYHLNDLVLMESI